VISRDWQCLNRRCGTTFHSYEKANPECPACGCVRVSWVPGGGHIGKVAPAADATLRSLATDYGMANLNSGSPSRLNRAAPKYEGASADTSLGVKHFAPGFASHYSPNGATCSPSLAPVDLRGKQPIGRAFVPSSTVPGPVANTEFAGRHAGR
jgi:hypothetical protein